MSTQVVTDLVHEKDQLVFELQRHQAALAAAVLAFGKAKGSGTELRISKAQLNKLSHRVVVRGLKTGGLVVEVEKVDE